MRRRRLVALAATTALGGCALFRRRARPVAATPPSRYVVGGPYSAGGVWRYPRETFEASETGLASAMAAHPGPLADGASYGSGALTAAHPTLQLPCVARVENLETGRSVLLRIDDRGPASPARLLALSPRALALLGPGSEPGVLRVRLEVREAASRALADALAADRDAIAVHAAPTTAVRSEPLPPLGAPARPSPAPVTAATAVATAPSPEFAASRSLPPPPPEQVGSGPVRATSLFIDLAAFSDPRYARTLAARLAGLGAFVDLDPRAPRDQAFRARIGPFASAREADAALDRTLAMGVVGARIVVDEE